LFNHQTRVTDERKRPDLARLVATEMNSIIQTLQADADAGSYRAVYLYSPMAEQAARSGLLDPQTTANMMRFTWNVQLSNQWVSQITTIQNSMGVNPNSMTLFQVFLNIGRGNRDSMIESARIILDEILEKYPQAFAED